MLYGFCSEAQKNPSVQVIARPQPNKILLKWAVDDAYAWSKANKYGFWLERKTITRNGDIVNEEFNKLHQIPIVPEALAGWEVLAKKDRNAAVIAQALFGKTFNVTNNANNSMMGRVMAVNQEIEQRFTFALLAAEQSFDATLLAGWGYIDTNVKPNERYLYKVSVAIPQEEALVIADNTVFVGVDMYKKLPEPIGLVISFDENIANITWDFGLLQSLYTSYDVERSKDGNSYTKLNNQPIFNAQKNKNGTSAILFYSDSIPNNTKFYYRVKGRTSFNEIGPASKAVFGKAQKSVKGVPHITLKEIIDPNTVSLQWKFPKESNSLITSFELRRSNKNRGVYKTVKTGIPATARKVMYKGLKRINYFTIVAKGKNGAESASFPTIVQPVDSIPPKPPVGMEGKVDTTGVVTLKWLPNTEEDLLGYRVYSSHNPKAEFTQITKRVLKQTSFTDTIKAKNLNKKVYYKFVAEDQRHNISKFSKMLTLDKPDRIPPSPPVIKSYKVQDDSVFLEWIPSSSKDVMGHIIYRKNTENTGQDWQNIAEIIEVNKTSFTDTNIAQGTSYKYTLIAKDSVGNESKPVPPIIVTTNTRGIKDKDIKFFAQVNRETQQIDLSWRVKKSNKSRIVSCRLYRGDETTPLQLYKTLNNTITSYTDESIEIGSNYTYGIQLVIKGSVPSVIKKIKVEY